MFYVRLILCSVAVVCCAASQQAPELAVAPPLALKNGQSIEVTLTGRYLSTIQSAIVLDPRGVTATLVEPPKDDQLRMKLTASSDASVGERRFRLSGPAGVTGPLRLFVSSYDVRPLGASDQPQDVQLPATVIGQIATAGQVQQFRFHGHQGELLIFDVSARRSGSPLEAVLTIQTESGRQLSCTLEHHAGDPLVLFTPPEDGDYVLHLSDLRFRGGSEFSFRIVAGHIPYLESVLPSSGKPGTIIQAKPIGYNMDSLPPIAIDLTHAAPGNISVHATAPLGISNDIPFEVTDLPQFAESEPNDNADEANLVQLPVEISGNTDRPADEDFFRFRIPYKQSVSLEVLAARLGSPMVPLLQLRSAKGDVIEANDGAADSDAQIIRELDAGEYLASVRDLSYSGGPGHWYRLKIEPARSLQPDFTARFQPDLLRVHRGGSAAVWFDVRRSNGFRGDITLIPESLPKGITASALTLPENGSGWITLSAAPDADLGTMPLRLRTQTAVGMVTVAHDPQPDAYLTVLDPAPFTVETVAALTPQQIDEASARLKTLGEKLTAPDSHIESAQAKWEASIPKRPIWTPLEPETFSSAKGTHLHQLSDGSIRVEGNIPDQDEYTVVANTDLKGITTVRLEAIADPRLPASGPGAAPNGNFVLSKFNLMVGEADEPGHPVELRRATSDFAQESFPASAAIDSKSTAGWAIDPQEGRTHFAIFRTASPIGSGAGTTLTFVLSHQSAFARHNLGRFRLSVTTIDPAVLNDVADLPPKILAIIATPLEHRSPQQRAEIAAYYRSIDPELTSLRNQERALRSFVGPYAELQRLQGALAASTPQFDADQKQWEQSVAQGDAWTVLQPTSATSDAATPLAQESDGSIFAVGKSPDTDISHITASSPIKSITAMRLELLPDPRLPASGPGRADDGSFVLTGFEIEKSGGKEIGNRALPITRAVATAEQKDSPISSLIGDAGPGHWSAGPGVGLPVEATFYFDGPVSLGDQPELSIGLHQAAQHGLGRFRLWVTSNPNPDAAQRLAGPILAILKTPDAGRSAGQKRQISEYFRSMSPSLIAIRDRMAELRALTPAMPPRARRNQPVTIPVLLNRADGFKGDVTVTLEGYVPGNPKMTATQIKVTPLILNADSLFGLLTIQPAATAEFGTRMVVLKAEAKMGDEVITQYSPAFPLTIQN
jgi:hypothetical protein